MANKRYYVSLICLSLFIVACLLASFVISRSVSSLDDSESETNGRQLKLSSARGSPPVEFETRTIHLVDLIECDKTFAYTRWRLSVRVPKSLPDYTQKPQFLSPDLTEIAQSSTDNKQQVALTNQPKPTSTTNSESSSHSTSTAKEQPDADDEEDEDHDESRYVLTSTNQFVANAQNNDQHNLSSRREDGSDSTGRAGRSARQLISTPKSTGTPNMTSEPDQKNKSLKEVMQLAGIDLDDPLQVAASDMKLSLSSINSSITDCFIVDTEKRFAQKVALEDRHRQVASTRRVDFDKMMTTIKACRELTWTTLTNRVTPLSTPRQLGLQEADRETPSASSRSTQVIGMASNSTIREIVRPVEKPNESRPAGPDLVGSLIGAWFSPAVTTVRPPAQLDSRRASESRQQNQLVAIPRQLAPQQPPKPTAKLVQPPVSQINMNSQEDQANRGSYINMGMSMVSGIVPNTLWCGLGDRAANYSELGAEFKIDSCCRAHDHCPIRLRPFGADYGLINWSMSTRSHCACDLDFSDCLTTINSNLSNVIKTLYFRFVGLQCIDVDGRQLVTNTALVDQPPVQ